MAIYCCSYKEKVLNKIVVFADNNVGLECTLFLLANHINDIAYIVVTDENSIVYKKIQQTDFNKSKVFFNKEMKNIDFSSVDYIFLLWWPNIIKKNIINSVKKGVINTHPSLLPFNRGKNYNFWNIVEDLPFGVSLHFVDEGIDSGDIIFQKEISKTWEDNGETLFNIAQLEMIALFKESYNKIINSNFTRKKQDLKKGSYHNSSELEIASEVFLSKRYIAKDLLNLLRARTFPPYNSCYFYDGGNKYEVKIKITKVEE